MIEVKAATKKFDHRGIAGLHCLDLSIPASTVFALMGHNGSGKSTLLKAIAGELQLDGGEINVQGKVHQFHLRELPANENVQRYLLKQITSDIDDEKKVQLTRDFADIFEFTFQLRQLGGQLSQGQRQKIMLAAELINNPEILLLDEPFVHLDPISRSDILTSLFHYIKSRNLLVVWVTHEKEDALRYADLVGLLHHGRLEQVDTPANFMLRPRNLFAAQFLGHKNFIHIKKSHDVWPTPWGPLEMNFPANESYLVIPPQAWIWEETSNFQPQLVARIAQPLYWELQLMWQEKNYYAYVGRDWDFSRILALKPDFQQCFLLPL
jgi:ABC-type sulfate/molybdate transport systems ATPase subunit